MGGSIVKNKIISLLLALMFIFSATTHLNVQAEDEIPRPTDIKKVY